jgi:predicted MFS family arabinose efflux permease
MTAAIALTSIAAQTFFPAQQALLITAFSERRSTALSWNNSALFLGITLGSLVGGRIMYAGGFAAIPTMSVALTLAGLLACSPKPADVRHAEMI